MTDPSRAGGGRGIFVVSLDFELHWGVRDVRTVDSYRENLLGVRRVVPELLKIFTEYDIHATWATVGLLFFRNRKDLVAGLPKDLPTYEEARLDPYQDLDVLGEDEAQDPYHYAADLIEKIQAAPNQEIATHTFSHYYCLEAGQTKDQFRSDLTAARRAAETRGLRMESVVFPRNQMNPEYVSVAAEAGFPVYRGVYPSWLYRPRSSSAESLARRVCRLADAYVPLSGRNTFPLDGLTGGPPFNVPASRFLRPVSKPLALFESLRRRRIVSDLRYAGRKRHMYHLWWHPHNFGARVDDNLAFLRRILETFATLRSDYRMRSLTMAECAREAAGR